MTGGDVVLFTFVLAFAITFLTIEALDRWTRAGERSEAIKAPSTMLRKAQRQPFLKRLRQRLVP
jgi:hypothetical protein